MFDDLSLTLNAQFLRARADLADRELNQLLDAAMANAIPGGVLSSEFRVQVGRGVNQFRYSLRIFKTARQVYFLPGQGLEDHIHAFVLVLEIDGHVVILKKSCANTGDHADAIGRQVTSFEMFSTFSDDKVSFQKLSVRNMTVSDKALRARTFEAADLKGIVSAHAAGRSIPYFLRIRSGRGLSSLSPTTARIFDSSDRVPASSVVVWARQKIRLLQSQGQDKSFLGTFAKSVDLHEVIRTSHPTSALVEVGRLVELIKERGGRLYTNEGGVKNPLRSEVSDRVLQVLERVFEIEPSHHVAPREFKVAGANARLKVNKYSLSIRSALLQRIHVELEDGEDSTLQALITRNHLFCVCFENPKYMYFMGQCFEDSSGISQIGELLGMLHPEPSLGAARSEKGEPFSAAQTRFRADSVFDIVERLHSGDDFLFCDDLGNEWADHISLKRNPSVISFIHSKHAKSVTTSASKLHDVVGQGIKNLGSMSFGIDQFLTKYQGLGFYAGTRIKRKRIGREADLRSCLKAMLSDYSTRRQCVLACDFISKAAVEAEFQKVRLGRPVKGHVVQLLWILSSFSHAAKEVSVEPKIYCRP